MTQSSGPPHTPAKPHSLPASGEGAFSSAAWLSWVTQAVNADRQRWAWGRRASSLYSLPSAWPCSSPGSLLSFLHRLSLLLPPCSCHLVPVFSRIFFCLVLELAVYLLAPLAPLPSLYPLPQGKGPDFIPYCFPSM